MAPPKKQSLPKPLPDGFILTDTGKKKWRLGRIIGQGGFGLIYLASPHVDRAVPVDADFVIKLEYHENGPLFSELKFYQRVAKKDTIQKWRRDKHLVFLGIPTYWGSGLAVYNGLRYRFMAMDRLGSDLQKVCDQNGGQFKPNTVLQLGQRLVDVLEYIHENEYVHADIKAANLMMGHRDTDQVYLADYGLSYRYCPEGVHKEYKENPKKGHDGTIEYTSLDAHRGVAPSRRSDLQILGFCLLHWLCGSLPWDRLLNNPTRVQEAKDRLMQNLPGSVKELSSNQVGTDEVASFLFYVKSLDYKDKPDYAELRGILRSSGGDLDLSAPQRPAAGPTPRAEEPPPRNKKSGRSRGQAKAELMELDEDSEEEAHRRKPKQIPTKYIRGPPINKPPQTGGQSLPDKPAHHKLSPGRFHTDDEDDEEKSRSKPIAACFLRGPPTSPKATDTQVKTTVRTKTSHRRPEQRMEIAANGNININSNKNNEKHQGDWNHFNIRAYVCEECGHRAAHVHTNRTGLQFWWVCVGLFLLLAFVALCF